MKWKEDLQGTFRAQSRTVLTVPQAHKQTGKKETSSFAVRCTLFLGVHRCALAIGQTPVRLTVTIGRLALGNASCPSSRLALDAPFPGSLCPQP